MEINKSREKALGIQTPPTPPAKTKNITMMQNAKQGVALPQDMAQVLQTLLKDAGFVVNEQSLNMLNTLMENNIPLQGNALQKIKQALQLFNLLDAGEGTLEKPVAENKPAVANQAQPVPSQEQELGLSKMQSRLENTYGINSFDVEEKLNVLAKTLTKTPETKLETPVKPQIYSEQNIQKAIFMLNNEIPINKSTASTLNSFVSGEGHFSKTLAKIAQAIENIDNPVLKATVTNAMLNNTQLPTAAVPPEVSNITPEKVAVLTTPEITPELIAKTLGIELKPSEVIHLAEKIFGDNLPLKAQFLAQAGVTLQNSPSIIENLLTQFSANMAQSESIDIALNQLNRNLATTQNLLIGQPYPELVENLVFARESLEFLNIMKDSIYMPLPMVFADTIKDGELFVFKDKNQSGNNKKNMSALIALNTASLGRVETYIQKTDNNLTLQFRLDTPATEPLIKTHLPNLQKSLKSVGYNIQNYSIISLEQPFNILSKESVLTDDPVPHYDLSSTYDIKT